MASVISNYIDELSSTQLYTAIVGATVTLCVVLLGPAAGGNENLPNNMLGTTTTSNDNNKKNAQQKQQPKWYLFKYINVGVFCMFVSSVAIFLWDASTYIHNGDRMTQFLVGWSLCLCYFFGFFGVFFIHQDLLMNQNQNQQGDSSDIAENKQEMVPKTKEVKSVSPPPKAKVVHEPAACAPVCSDPASFNSSSSSNKKAAISKDTDITGMTNDEIAQLVLDLQVKDHELEKRLDPFRAVTVRRLIAQHKLQSVHSSSSSAFLEDLPEGPSLDYSKVFGTNCEMVVGYVPLPVGMVGPLTLNGESVYFPMATTEGCLVASTQRGAKAISQGTLGAQALIVKDGITRAPCVRMASAMEAAQLKLWCQEAANLQVLKEAFESTTSFGKLLECHATVAGKNVYLRLVCFSGDAMGMNMVSKGSLKVIETLQNIFPNLELVALSGNMCTDKKAAATNWLHGRGKSVVVEAVIPKDVVKKTLKTTVPALVSTNQNKNLIGSAMAGAMGGFNAHASNIVTAIFLATGQDPAQNVESANCITLMEQVEETGDLWISCTMPSIEVGTVGGGTTLPAQAACLEILGCKGGSRENPGKNAQKLALVVAAATMAGELSLMSALAANTLVQAHMKHNRKKTV
eukprot:CAMPEP_0113648764 /NCGR_PEP_ID=MMETSP0017_2-20120614/25888_1 /TAXON_ID=2856 /ORGANISM="Cylindrotheca closterium" /LENGTH=629 /DNA_ID=CAMNT_0000561049 /DNA_START=314 /DNA_END=2203 /DNA_ORIENTATION=+ /assembly_acc=CAM_ASM_000147